MSYQRFRLWCKTQEPVIRFCEVCIIASTGAYLAYQQTVISERALSVAEADHRVAEAELQLVDIQTKLALREMTADFRFRPTSDGPGTAMSSAIVVKDRNERARHANVIAKLYLEFPYANGNRRVLIEGFFRPITGAPVDAGEELRIEYPSSLYFQTMWSLAIYNIPAVFNRRVGWVVERNIKPMVYCELSYIDGANLHQKERFCMAFASGSAYPVAQEPKYDATIMVPEVFHKFEKEGPQHETAARELADEVVKVTDKLYGYGGSLAD